MFVKILAVTAVFSKSDSANTHYKLIINESLHDLWEIHDLNKQVQRYNFSLSF